MLRGDWQARKRVRFEDNDQEQKMTDTGAIDVEADPFDLCHGKWTMLSTLFSLQMSTEMAWALKSGLVAYFLHSSATASAPSSLRSARRSSSPFHRGSKDKRLWVVLKGRLNV